jgi:hypothetical protein
MDFLSMSFMLQSILAAIFLRMISQKATSISYQQSAISHQLLIVDG